MDSHHEQVMKARAAAGNGTRLYFAYSTILDREAFVEWRGQHGYDAFDLPVGALAEAVDVALAYDFPSRWWGGRVAGLVDQPGQSVFGRLFEISEKDWPVIAHKEGGITGMSVERPVKVRSGGQLIDATAFATNPRRQSSEGPISPRFVEALMRGAKAAGLPEEWIAALGSGAK
jgi:gamma-glutamylcyclotransferase